VVNLGPNKTVVGNGDLFVMNLAVDERISDMGELVAYVVVQTPHGAWFSFVPNACGGFYMKSGIMPAARGAVIPAMNASTLRQLIDDSLVRGDYWFGAAVFHAGDRITFADWRDLAIYSSEATVTVR